MEKFAVANYIVSQVSPFSVTSQGHISLWPFNLHLSFTSSCTLLLHFVWTDMEIYITVTVIQLTSGFQQVGRDLKVVYVASLPSLPLSFHLSALSLLRANSFLISIYKSNAV